MLLPFEKEGVQCDECGTRAVIHVAYYAVFHYVASELGLSVIGAGYSKHGEVWRVLIARSHEKPGLVEAKRVFNTLRDLRQRADYNLGDPLSKVHAKDAVDLAFCVFDTADIIPNAV